MHRAQSRTLACGLLRKGPTMDSLEKLINLAQECREDYNKAKGGNKAAGTRVRKTMQDIKNAAQDIRKEMLESRD